MSVLGRGVVLAKRYTLDRRLGASEYTESWLAKDRMTSAQVALKISKDQSRDALLRREWQLSLRLVHPHIVRVFEYDDGNPAFYSQQFIDGPMLSCLTGKPVEDSLPALAAISDALRYAHSKNVVHLDLKASNVLLDRQGACYLIDFGVAAHGTDAVGGGSLIASSPQRLAGEPVSTADDVFALGGLFYEVISGDAPYSAASTALDIREQTPPPLQNVPAALADVVSRMLLKDAALRPSIADVVAALEGLGARPGLVPRHYLRESQTPDQSLQPASIQPKRHARAAPQPRAHESASGISPRNLGIGLLALLSILALVVFFLPSTVDDSAQQSKQQTPVVQTDDGSAEPAVPADGQAGDDATPAVDEMTLRDQRVAERAATEEVLGELLAKFETLEERAVERWGGLDYTRARSTYAEGDAAYLQRDYATAAEQYALAIEQLSPLLDRVDAVFDTTMAEGRQALTNANAPDAVSAFELAVAMSRNSSAAQAGLARAKNLSEVLSLVDQGVRQERDLELAAARQSFSSAVELDPQWSDAVDGLRRVNDLIEQDEFATRMSEGIGALNSGDLLGARAAFRMADQLRPGAAEPADGLLQVEQELRLRSIASLETTAQQQESSEQWELAVESYRNLLEIDATLQFAKDGLQNARAMVDLYSQVDDYIAEPDQLSRPTTMQRATQLMINMTRMPQIGPRLEQQRDELSRLLKRASTPLNIRLVSDNQTAVSVYKVGRLGTFETHDLELRPGSYVAVGSRSGYRDVRVEFRVAPELDLEPVVVRCEEPI